MNAKKFLKDNGYDPNDEIHKLKSGGVTTKLHHILEDYIHHLSKERNSFYCEEETPDMRKCETQCDYCKDKPKIQKA